MTREIKQYEHDCDKCVFLGRLDDYDLYYCHQGNSQTVIARYGNEGPDYTSGLAGIGSVPQLTEAARRAVEAGLLTRETPTGSADGKTIGDWLVDPKTVDPKDLQLFKAAQTIALIILGYNGRNDELWLDNRIGYGPNPYYCQTKRGLFLELYYGLPNCLWTPWGKWNFGGSGSGHWEKILPELILKFDLKLYQELRVDTMGEYGPVYSVNRVGDTILPEAIQESKFREYDRVKGQWEALSRLAKMPS